MELRFYIDPDTEEAHIHNHGVMEEEVRQILARPAEDRAGSNDSRIALGQTREGRYLRVIYVPDHDSDSAFVVTAYELRGKQLTAFRRRRRRRPK